MEPVPAAYPQLADAATDVNWTLVVAVLAVTISAIALVLSWLSFRRSGARVRVKLDSATSYKKDGSGAPLGVLLVTGTNRGMARAHVTALWLEVEGEHSVFVTEFHAGEIPWEIDGFDRKLWSIEPGKMPFEKRTNRILNLRVRLELGGLKSVESNWKKIEMSYDGT